MPCIYILKSESSAKFYVGSSREDLGDTRLQGHNSGKTKSTRFGRPWKLIHQESFQNYTDARKRENFLKTGVGRNWIKNNFV